MNFPRGQLLMVAAAALIGLAGCASIGAPLPPSLELPHPPTDLRAVRKGRKVTLRWSVPAHTMDRQRVRYLGKTRICRSLDKALTTCDDFVGQVDPPPDFSGGKESGGKKAAAYSDTLPGGEGLGDIFGTATYAVEVLNRDGRGAGLSNQVHVPTAEALAPPKDFTAQVTGAGVVLSWTGASLSTPVPKAVHLVYRVFRRTEGGQTVLVGEREAGLEAGQSLIDQTFEWEKTYYYHAESFTVISQAGKPDVSIEGDDTAEVKVFTHDVFPPATPSEVQAVFSGIGQQAFVDVIWAPVSDADLEGYNVYRHEAGGAAVKLNGETVKTPAYRDVQVVSGKKYFYSVSAVDLRGNESARSQEAAETVP